ncbi:N-acetylglucosamine kinase [Actinokineospora sp. HUAS TT18]|uniref:N-acetylglucosamine kinase n=1 Tax=Actinokineospora sp. HUAS TT18 TaxID=3447451 RepID=UPI003F520D68
MGVRTVLAVDGGNSKTDVALVTADGVVLGRARGPGFTPHQVGVSAAVDVIAATVRAAMGDVRPPFADHVSAYLAGADLPEDETALRAELEWRGYGRSVEVGNDTFAVLRAGSRNGWGVAVVCGAGVNAVGVGPDGRVARFPALGRVSGDWGGGMHLAEEVLWHAVRAEDGRGAATALVALVRSRFGVERVVDVSLGLHRGEIAVSSLDQLVGPLFDAAGSDEVAAGIVARMADEVCALGLALLDRLDLRERAVEVVLGGGVLTAASPAFLATIRRKYARRAPLAELVVSTDAPIVGVTQLGLDHLGATRAAYERAAAGLVTIR